LILVVWVKAPMDEDYESLEHGSSVTLKDRRVEMVIDVRNSGDAPARTSLAIWTLSSCKLQAEDNRLNVSSNPTGKCIRGNEQPLAPCQQAMGTEEIPPGDYPTFFYASFEVPDLGAWPLMVGCKTAIKDPDTGNYGPMDRRIYANVVVER